MKDIYLDHAATTPTDPKVLEAILPYFTEKYGNPSSLYSISKTNRRAITKAREQIAETLGAKTDEIVFTSGGSESNNFALKGIAFANRSKGNHIITSSIEHHAGIRPCEFLEEEGFEITYLPVDKYGLISPDNVKNAITDKTILISIMHANNEIGTIQPISIIGRIAKEHEIYFHSDAVQSFGHIPVNVNDLNVDLLSMSAHKLYGPKGVGALYIRKGTKIEPLIHGGDQEKKRRASTENVAEIVGFGKAVELAEKSSNEAARQSEIRDVFIEKILSRIDDCRLNGHPEKRLPNNINLSFEGIEGESIVLHLDMEGIYASTGSACSSSSLKASHVLLATGISPKKAHGSLRLTLGKDTTREDMEHVANILPNIVDKLRVMSPLYKNKE